ncbi:nitrate- and nitrite sensing domain-containing protein [Streptomyces sp. NPDC054796]
MTMTPTPDHRAPRARRRLLTVRARLMLVAVVSITALLGFVVVDAWGDWQQQTALRNDSATGELGGEASLPLFVGAQAERKLTAAYLARPTKAAKKALDEQRAVTDKGVASFRHLSGTELETSRRHKWEYVERVYQRIEGLEENRRAVDARTGDAEEATGYYTALLSSMVEFYQALSAMDDAQLTQETRPLVGLFWASEGASQQDALVAKARAAGRMSVGDRRAFAEAYGAQRVMYTRWIVPYLPEKDRATWDRIVSTQAWRTVQDIERDVIAAPTSTSAGNGAVEDLPSSVGRWDAAYGQVAQQIAGLNLSRTQGLLAHGYERAEEIRTQVYVKLGISLAIVIALALLIFGIIRSVLSRLRGLQSRAEETATRLPAVVDRLQAGAEVEVHAEFPLPQPRGDEFTGLENALVSAQHTAVHMARAQAGDRRGFAAFVAVTSGRALNLLGVQLTRLAVLETKYGRKPQDAPVLEDLISVDHPGVATRRHLDNLLTLAGGHDEPYTQPRALGDIVHDAAAETDSPERVTNKVRAQVWIQPQAVNAVMHVIAALLDNALSFSRATVTVTSLSPVHGIALHIEDMGTGMTAEEFEAANEKLAAPPTFESMAQHHDGRLGLFVIGHLARRHGLTVRLRPSDYGGTTGVVMLPHSIQCDQPVAPQPESDPATTPPEPQPAPASRTPLPARPAPSPSSPPEQHRPARPTPAPSAGADNAVRTDHGAPPLPVREPQKNLAPQLAQPSAPLPAYDPATDVSPETVGANWSAWQAAGRDTDHTPASAQTEQKDESR